MPIFIYRDQTIFNGKRYAKPTRLEQPSGRMPSSLQVLHFVPNHPLRDYNSGIWVFAKGSSECLVF